MLDGNTLLLAVVVSPLCVLLAGFRTEMKPVYVVVATCLALVALCLIVWGYSQGHLERDDPVLTRQEHQYVAAGICVAIIALATLIAGYLRRRR